MFVFVMLSCLFVLAWERADILAFWGLVFSCVFSFFYVVVRCGTKVYGLLIVIFKVRKKANIRNI